MARPPGKVSRRSARRRAGRCYLRGRIASSIDAVTSTTMKANMPEITMYKGQWAMMSVMSGVLRLGWHDCGGELRGGI